MKNTIQRIIVMILMAGLGSVTFAMETNNNQPWYRRLVSSLASYASGALVRPEQETYDALPQEDAQERQVRIDAENRERAAREAAIAAEDAADAGGHANHDGDAWDYYYLSVHYFGGDMDNCNTPPPTDVCPKDRKSVV